MEMNGTIILVLTTSVCVCVCTVVLVLDGKAEDVAGPEARAVIHAAVEERVRVGILDVQDLTRGGHMTRNALVCRDPELLLQPRGSHRMGASAAEHQSLRPGGLIEESYLLVTYDTAVKDFGHQLVAEAVQQEDRAAARGCRFVGQRGRGKVGEIYQATQNSRVTQQQHESLRGRFNCMRQVGLQ